MGHRRTIAEAHTEPEVVMVVVVAMVVGIGECVQRSYSFFINGGAWNQSNPRSTGHRIRSVHLSSLKESERVREGASNALLP